MNFVELQCRLVEFPIAISFLCLVFSCVNVSLSATVRLVAEFPIVNLLRSI